jgi:CRP/FNR family cyclic AMP-dependent transcriptional regulator
MDLSGIVQLFKQVPYFRSLPPGEVRELAARLRQRHYRANDVILRKGDRCEGLCIVLSGRVRTVSTSEQGREQVLKVFGPGRTFADIPVFDDEPNPAEAVAVIESTIVVVPQADVLDLLRRHPDVCLDVLRLFASRLRAYKQVVEDLALRTVVARVARLLVDRARGAPTLVEEPADRSLTYAQDEIAAMVGSVREVVQRALKALEHAGLVEIERGRIYVIDADALSGWTEQAPPSPMMPHVRPHHLPAIRDRGAEATDDRARGRPRSRTNSRST